MKLMRGEVMNWLFKKILGKKEKVVVEIEEPEIKKETRKHRAVKKMVLEPDEINKGVLEFLNNNVVVRQGKHVATSMLYDRYKNRCIIQDIVEVDRETMVYEISKLGFRTKRANTGYVIVGLALIRKHKQTTKKHAINYVEVETTPTDFTQYILKKRED